MLLLLLLDVGNEYEQNLQESLSRAHSKHHVVPTGPPTTSTYRNRLDFEMVLFSRLDDLLLRQSSNAAVYLDQNAFCVAGVSDLRFAFSVSAYAIKSRYLTLKINLLFSGLLLDGKHSARYGLSFCLRANRGSTFDEIALIFTLSSDLFPAAWGRNQIP